MSLGFEVELNAVEVRTRSGATFAGRLDTWTPFAGKDAELGGTFREDLKVLKRGLLGLGEIVTSHDVEPVTEGVSLDIQESDESDNDGLYVPLDERL
ncbi:hypothetical protein JYK02_38340 [Corallococcus macrosporus]|uniref:Uncharacterized protein n=1 Tax=Corallococcus macrosporus TaxID=35 RepID=A0ABS3DQ06_9BACT|nr:hypothetical protein [Corallococcus macrosporus]MBN8233394.1 hypothetical protein [Corallococcus macrosporus]